MKASKTIIGVLMLLFLGVFYGECVARSYTPEEIVNPNISDRRVYVADPDNRLNASTKREVNEMLYNLRLKTGAEVGVVVVGSMGDMPIEEFSDKLFSSWGLGKSDRDNGVLILIAVDDKAARLTTGYGVEGIIPDISAKRIIEKDIVPAMREGNLDNAVYNSAASVAAALSDPTVAEELKSSKGEAWERTPESDVDAGDLLALLFLTVGIMFIISWFLYFYDRSRLKKMDRVTQAQVWHSRRPTYIGLAIGSLGFGLIPYLLAERQRKKTRNKPMECPTCKAKMHKLSEEDDNAYLSPSQDLEEHLNTVDYDVWVCPECGTIERYPFKVNQKTYTECPVCHTTALRMVRDHTLTPATYRSAGVGERIYECMYCHHKKNDRYTIPRKENNVAAAAVAGSILGGMSGGNRGGGFGGGFGGGRTGGGGASGRW